MKLKTAKANQKLYFIGFLVFILILIQHLFVYLYFDDLGYVSLTYRAGNKFYVGMDYNIIDILEYLNWHYFNWGGRVTFFFFEILLVHLGGILGIQIAQSIVIFMILLLSIYAIDIEDIYRPRALMCLFALYALIDIYTFQEGIFWYTASVLYTWPLLFLLIGILCFKKGEETHSKRYLYISYFCMFFGATAQEQIAILFIVYNLFQCIIHFIIAKYPQEKRQYFICFLFSLIGGAFEIFAPGNFMRLSSSEDSISPSLIDRISSNLYAVVNVNFKHESIILICVLTAVCIFLIITAYKLNRLFSYLIGSAIVITNSYILLLWKNHDQSMKWIYSVLVWFVLCATFITAYLIASKKWILLSIMAAATCSQIMLLVMPAVATRSHTMFVFCLNILIIDLLVTGFRSRTLAKFAWILLCFICFSGIINYTYITNGYAQNIVVHNANDKTLKTASDKISSGELLNEVVFYKLKDDTFGYVMPYQENRSFVEFYYKKYYELPDDIVFKYIDY